MQKSLTSYVSRKFDTVEGVVTGMVGSVATSTIGSNASKGENGPLQRRRVASQTCSLPRLGIVGSPVMIGIRMLHRLCFKILHFIKYLSMKMKIG